MSSEGSSLSWRRRTIVIIMRQSSRLRHLTTGTSTSSGNDIGIDIDTVYLPSQSPFEDWPSRLARGRKKRDGCTKWPEREQQQQQIATRKPKRRAERSILQVGRNAMEGNHEAKPPHSRRVHVDRRQWPSVQKQRPARRRPQRAVILPSMPLSGRRRRRSMAAALTLMMVLTHRVGLVPHEDASYHPLVVVSSSWRNLLGMVQHLQQT
mmetsp:Transcript_19492/g.56076  ORF Transcript_19492/g.56076 Transcript_19492/m.56076 type:complete len:208 (+) Transcript_19492:230-853(+)